MRNNMVPDDAVCVRRDTQTLEVRIPAGGEVKALLHALADSLADGFKSEGEKDGWTIVAEVQGRQFKMKVIAVLTVIPPRPAGVG